MLVVFSTTFFTFFENSVYLYIDIIKTNGNVNSEFTTIRA